MVDTPNQVFTPTAAALWRKIPDWAQEKLLANVWRRRCGATTTIMAYHGAVVKGDLVLSGACATCGGPVSRLIETGD